MATYAVSFNIKYDSEASYTERYSSFMSRMRQISGRMWAETTSFCLCETDLDMESFERSLWLTSFDATKDKMLVLDVHYDSAIARGSLDYPSTLRALLPLVSVK